MRNKLILLGLMIAMFLTLAACGENSANVSTSKSYTFSIDNGDTIKLSLDTSGGYDITSDIPFEISCNDEAVSQGTFIDGAYYEEYAEAAQNDENVQIIDSGEKDGNKYVFWSYNSEEFNYVIMVGNSDTGLILGNIVSQESAQEVFERMTLSVE